MNPLLRLGGSLALPLLFNVDHDLSEKYNIAEEHTEAIAEIKALVEAHKKTVKPVKDQLAERIQKAK